MYGSFIKKREILKGITEPLEVIEQCEEKINRDVGGNRKLFWKEVGKVNGEKIESCSRMKDGDGRG